ncbi:MAG: hypothetical protein J7L43_00665 [Candidatus Aenigmarchaeota archaeon]|nr:hypothetical protein [Candidatus Aenigmarchaeota archaeon]
MQIYIMPLFKIEVPTINQILKYYSREDILKEMLKLSKNREFVGSVSGKGYMKRPSIVQYPTDIIQAVKNGATSFHISVERWSNPMQLSTENKNYDELRIGWDLLMDIDSRLGMPVAQKCAKFVIDFLKKYKITSFGIKFSGSRGFHILVPFEAFPKEINYQPTAKQYPRIPRTLVEFIKENVQEKLLKWLVGKFTAKRLVEISKKENLNAFDFVEIESGWGERHLFRAPYSLNEKTWLVSIPIKDPEEFDPKKAKIESVKVQYEFFKPKEKEATDLLIDALDWAAKKEEIEKERPKRKKRIVVATKKVPENLFPPCIKEILKGLHDGKKRSVFTLISFLRNMNWSWEEIEEKLYEWNKKNTSPLSKTYIKGQLNWNKRQKNLLPANCDRDLFYKDIGICKPDEICKNIKNPVNYPFKLMPKNKGKKKERYICRICNKSFKTLKGLKIHQIKYHDESVL